MNRVLVSGLRNTRPYIVNRQMRIHDGDALSQNRMVDSQRRLYSLGLFNEVNMAVQNPDGQEPSKDVLFNLQEAKRWTFRYGGGIEFATGNIPTTTNPQGATGISPNAVLEITRLNLFGRDQTFSIRGRYGLLTRRGLATYEAPHLFHRENWRIIVSALYDNTADVNTFASERVEGALQAEQRFNRFTTLIYGLTFQRVAIDPNSLVIDPTLIALYSKPVFIAMPTFTMVRDRRDDPINPKKGSYNALNLGLATSALGSQTNFGRVLLDNSTYYTVKKNWVIARRTQIGIEKPYGTNDFIKLPPESTLPVEATQIPLPELFFSGGSNSLRSFSINQAGPRDPETGYPIGGQGLFVNNIELRTPPVQLPFVGNNLGFVFFHDMGNVFDTANHIISGMLTFNQPSIADCAPPNSKTACNFNYDSQAIGMGIRYKTPVGPVRFDLGYAVNATRYPGAGRQRNAVAAPDQRLFQYWTDFLMKRILYFAICSVLLFLTAVVPAFAGEVIDGVVASVNRQPVLRSDWDEAAAFEAFMQQKPIAQLTEADRVLALQHLIDRQLLKAQMGDAKYMQPSDEALQQDVAKLRAQVPSGTDDIAWHRVLANYGLNEEIVREHLRTEVQVMNFVEVRLRPDVHIQQDDVESYYQHQLLPDLQKNGGKPIPLGEVEPRIRELLTEQRIDEMLDAWLHNLRQQAEIHSSVAIPGVNAPDDTATGASAGN